MKINTFNSGSLNDSTSNINTVFSEDYFWNRISDDALVSTIITILVFIIGHIVDYGFRKFSEHREKKEIKSFIYFHLKKITDEYLPKIVDKYKEVSKSTSVDTGVLATPPKILSNDFERILNIDNVTIFKNFKIKEKRNVSNIISQVEYVNKLLIEIQTYHQNFLDKSDPMRKDFEDDLYDYFNLLAEFLEFEKKENNNKRYPDTNRLINDKIILYYKEIAGTRQLDRLMNEIVRMIQKHLVQTELYRNHELAKQIVGQGKSISHLFTSINDLTNEYNGQYLAFSTMMENSKKSLIDNINKIDWNLSKEEKDSILSK